MYKFKQPPGGVPRKKVLLKFENIKEIFVKELFFNTISALQPANTIKKKFLRNTFHGFCLHLRNN